MKIVIICVTMAINNTFLKQYTLNRLEKTICNISYRLLWNRRNFAYLEIL